MFAVGVRARLHGEVDTHHKFHKLATPRRAGEGLPAGAARLGRAAAAVFYVYARKA